MMNYASIYDTANLWLAWGKVQRKKQTTPGVDRMKISDFARQAERFLMQLQQALASQTYRPSPLKQVRVPKWPGSPQKRLLVIPTLKDRVAQHAVLNVIHPALNGRLSQACFAYRPGLSVLQALQRIQHYQQQGLNQVVRLDIVAYFDSIDHSLLLQRLREWIPDLAVRELINQWVEQSPFYPLGIPQGAVISPLLANLYLHPVDQALLKTGAGLVRYADDLVLLCRSASEAQHVFASAQDLLQDQGLQAHPDKSYLTDFERGFDFLGARFENNQLHLPEWLWPQVSVTPVKCPPMPAHAVASLPEKTSSFPAENNSDSATETNAELFQDPLSATQRTLYVQEQGSRLQLQSERLVLTKNSTVLMSIPAQAVDQIVIMGVCGLTPAVLRYCLRQHMPVYHLSSRGEYLGETCAHHPQRGERQYLQFQSLQQPERVLSLARAFVVAKIHNTRLFLRFLSKSMPLNVQETLIALKTLTERAQSCQKQPSLLGYEGTAAHSYFACLQQILPPDWGFQGRKKQPPPDRFNALLSLGYTLLYRWIQSWLLVHRLSPDLGYLHRPRNGHSALASDLMEEFRAPVVDFVAMQLVQRQTLTLTHFESTDQGWRLTPEGLKVFLAGLEQRLQTLVRHPLTQQQVSLQRCLELQVLQLLSILEDRQKDYVAYCPANW